MKPPQVPPERRKEYDRIMREISGLAQPLSVRLTTLATGVLAFSVIFKDDISDRINALGAAWMLLFLSIACGIFVSYLPIAVREDAARAIIAFPDRSVRVTPKIYFVWAFRFQICFVLVGILFLALLSVIPEKEEGHKDSANHSACAYK